MSETATKPGLLARPYPVDHCANENCTTDPWLNFDAYLYRDLDSGRLVVLCEDCGMLAELLRAPRFLLIGL